MICLSESDKGNEMSKSIFINLPVKDVAASTAFYEAIGFEKNPHFSNEQALGILRLQ